MLSTHALMSSSSHSQGMASGLRRTSRRLQRPRERALASMMDWKCMSFSLISIAVLAGLFVRAAVAIAPPSRSPTPPQNTGSSPPYGHARQCCGTRHCTFHDSNSGPTPHPVACRTDIAHTRMVWCRYSSHTMLKGLVGLVQVVQGHPHNPTTTPMASPFSDSISLL